MKQTVPLRFNYEFSRVYKRGRFLTGTFVVVHFLKRKSAAGQNRLGVAASRGVTGSVRRNRLKRLIRESYRLQENQLASGYDLIITGRQKETPPTFAQLDRELGRILRKAGIRQEQESRKAQGVQPERPENENGTGLEDRSGDGS